MLASLPVAVCETDPDGRLVAVNDAFRALVLGGAPVVVGSAPWVNAAPAERAAAELAWEQTRQLGVAFTHEFRLLGSDGDMRWISLHMEPVRDASSRLTG